MSHTITDEQIAEAVAQLDAIEGTDPEAAHQTADGIMESLTPPEVVEAQDRLKERAWGWWWA